MCSEHTQTNTAIRQKCKGQRSAPVNEGQYLRISKSEGPQNLYCLFFFPEKKQLVSNSCLYDWTSACGWVCERACVFACLCVCAQLVTISANRAGNVKAGNGLKGKLQYRIKLCNGKLWFVGFFVSARVLCPTGLHQREPPGSAFYTHVEFCSNSTLRSCADIVVHT